MPECFCDRFVRIRTIIIILVLSQLFVIYLNVSNYSDKIIMSYSPLDSMILDLYSSTTTPTTFVNESLEDFVLEYRTYCESSLLPKEMKISEMLNFSRTKNQRKLCSCVPEDLVGYVPLGNLTFDDIPMIGELELEHKELQPGGRWFPKTCIRRHNVAIIVPFRDREEHLRFLLSILHPMLQRQMLQYTIFVIEQVSPAVFNKASLMNAGFLEAQAEGDFDCFIFHDVDMIPENDYNFYTCSVVPRHVGSHLDKWDYQIGYEELLGGAVAFRAEHFRLVNGYSNQYYGWGGEDDDMHRRLMARNLSFVRFPSIIARYTMIKHSRDSGNPLNDYRSNILNFKHRHQIYHRDGLNSVRYKVTDYEYRPLYIWIQVALPPHPSYFKLGVDRRKRTSSSKTPSHHSANSNLLTFLILVCCVLCRRL